MNFAFALPGGDLTFFAVVLLAIFAAIFSIAHLVVGQPRQRIVARAMAARQRYFPTRSASPNIAARDRRQRERRDKGIDAIINRLTPNADRWRAKLARSGTPLSLGSVVLLGAALAIALGAGLTVAGFAMIYAWPAGLALSAFGLRFYIRRLIKRRSAAFLKLLPDAIGLMVRGLRSGLPVAETIQAASREIRDPLGEELRRIADQVQLGRPLEEVMAASAERNDLPEMAFMAVAFSIQRETGGNLAEMLENLDTILRRRRHMQLKVRAYTGEARASAMIIGALPFVLVGLLSVVNFEYISSLFTTSMGHIFLGAAGGCIALGIGTLVKLARFQI